MQEYLTNKLYMHHQASLILQAVKFQMPFQSQQIKSNCKTYLREEALDQAAEVAQKALDEANK